MGLFRHRRPSKNNLKKRLKRQARRYKYRWVRRITVGFSLIIISGGISTYYYFYRITPPLNTVFKSTKQLDFNDQPINIKYLNDQGKLFYQSNASTYKAFEVSDIAKSQNVVHALIATEDRNFYQEHGVNWLRTIKAAFQTAFGHEVIGGSTIYQQLIKLSFFSTSKADQTIKRKGQEIILAQQLAKKYSKNQILTWYLNKTNYGNGQQGIIAAARFYYDKTPQELSILEAATLVGIVNSPTMYNPYSHPKLMQSRRNVVLTSLYEIKKISKSQLKTWSKLPVSKGLVLAHQNDIKLNHRRQAQLKYNEFVSATNAQLNRYDTRFLTHSLTIQTTMNQRLQDAVTKIVQNSNFSDAKLQTGIVVLDNRTGGVVAMDGSRYHQTFNAYSRAYNLNRSSGSSIKPLLDYGPSFDLGYLNANSYVDDSPYSYPNTNVVVHDWDNQYQGLISVRQALVQSRNIPAVKTLAQVGLLKGRKSMMALGLGSKQLYYPNAIGVNTNPLAMASAYSSLANAGNRVNSRLINQIYNPNNKQVLQIHPVVTPIFSDDTANQLTNILKGVFVGNGTATLAHINGIDQAGKTGTVDRDGQANALTDAWMVGYTKQYTVAVWVGYDNPYSNQYVLNNQKANVAQIMYKQIMQKAMSYKNVKNNTTFANFKQSKRLSFLNSASSDFVNVPFSIPTTPQRFLGVDNLNLEVLNDVYKHVNEK